tara:strand:+ start:1798 stop:2388 length:591 start_codon:yes stop_codon:yes gene_type:complete
MGVLKKDFKYKIVKNFLNKEELEIGKRYFLLLHKKNQDKFDFNGQSNNKDTCLINDFFTDTILLNKLKKMEEETSLELAPTYAYSRVYTYSAELFPHKDRPSCEVSVTVMWDSCKTNWPIFMEGNECSMEPGDAVIYLGCELEHYRKEFTGDYHIQSFFHYIDLNGPYKQFIFDRKDYFNSSAIDFEEYSYYVKKI